MSDTEQKKHSASDSKLRKQRQQGQVAQISQSLNALTTMAGIFAVLFLSTRVLGKVESLFDVSFFLVSENKTLFSLHLLWGQIVSFLVSTAIVVFAAVISIAIVCALLMNNGFVFSIDPVLPKVSRASPMVGIKRIFGKRGWIEFATLVAKTLILIVTSAAVWLVLLGLASFRHSCSTSCMFEHQGEFFQMLLILFCALLIVFSAFDFFVQRFLFSEDQKMTDSEVQRERKDQFGHPEIASARNVLRDELMNGTIAKRLGIDDSTIAFKSNQGVITINFEPPEQGVPIIVAKARTPSARKLLGKRLSELDVPFVVSENIVRNAMRKGKGQYIDTQHFREFAEKFTDQRNRGLIRKRDSDQ